MYSFFYLTLNSVKFWFRSFLFLKIIARVNADLQKDKQTQLIDERNRKYFKTYTILITGCSFKSEEFIYFMFFFSAATNIPDNDRRWNHIQDVRNNWECWTSSISSRLQVRSLNCAACIWLYWRLKSSVELNTILLFVAIHQKHSGTKLKCHNR